MTEVKKAFIMKTIRRRWPQNKGGNNYGRLLYEMRHTSSEKRHLFLLDVAGEYDTSAGLYASAIFDSLTVGHSYIDYI